jgi:hypothetical protein
MIQLELEQLTPPPRVNDDTLAATVALRARALEGDLRGEELAMLLILGVETPRTENLFAA